MQYASCLRYGSAVVLTAALLLTGTPAQAQTTACFDFETVGQGVYSGAAALSCSAGDVSLQVRRADGFSVHSLGNLAAPFWGDRSLSFFPSIGPSEFLLSFSHAVQSFAVDVGDFGAVPNDVIVEALDGGGNVVGRSSGQVPAGHSRGFGYITLTLGAAAGGSFQTVRLRNAGHAANKLFWDNARVSTAAATPAPAVNPGGPAPAVNPGGPAPAVNPEPGSLSLLAAGLLGLAAFGRRKRSR
jgi:hypothetical protein